MTMMRPNDLLNAGRMFQSQEIDELYDALTEDDDGPDGGNIKKAMPPTKKQVQTWPWY
ncbi:hypothetical protein PH7735_01702 [Shimia thalassica]|uniref:Uncharacterized protein n=1 Tax=Shimia thalassica TaxID=1715693 RepID=A0A0P1I6T9_9RHOB|nr:hypothetical protein [Shimia thalassica]CUJ94065.1 hypothetical protein PH7735_01702 [Shimia thalassica]